MTDPGYIFAAAKLADGWNVYGQLIMPPWAQEKGPVMHVYNPSTILVDAMAAQLVRQVDALGPQWHVVIDDNYTSIMDGCVTILEKVTKVTDRTMITIKAIVDSKVLM